MTSRTIQLATNKMSLIFLLLALSVGIAHAQNGIWKVDAEHSIARFSLGSRETGVARVGGNVAFDSSNTSDPIVNLNIQPANGVGANYSEISFKSKRSSMTSDGEIAVVGDLSVTRVERGVAPYLGGGEGYYGAQYMQPVVHTDTREVTLVFPAASLAAAHNGRMQLSASTDISRERFPQLLEALAQGGQSNFVVQDENCTMPATVSEDYSGAICSGTPVEAATNRVTTYAGGGEGYYGSAPAAIPDGTHAILALNLKLAQVASAPSAAQTAGH